KNLKAEFEVILSKATTVFENYRGYVFDDPTKDFYSEGQKIFEGSLDETGKAAIDVALKTEDAAPGMLMAHFKGKVFEESGNFSIDRFSIPYYPYDKFVGIRLPEGDKRGMLLTDTLHTIHIATVDAYGKPVSSKGIEIE